MTRPRIAQTDDQIGFYWVTRNGDPTDLESFASHERSAFNGLCLVIVRGLSGRAGVATLRAEAEGLKAASVALRSSETVNSVPREK